MEILEIEQFKKQQEFIPEPGPREGFTNRQFGTINSGRGDLTNRDNMNA